MYYYIVNSSDSKIQGLEKQIREELGSYAIGGQFSKTERGSASKLAELALAQGLNTIVAIGGDATVKEIATRLALTEGVLGVIPAGRTNELAHLFGVGHWKEAAPALATRRIVRVPLAALNNSGYMVAHLLGGSIHDFHKNSTVAQKAKRYLASVIRSAVFRHPHAMSFYVDGQQYTLKTTAFRVTNGFFETRPGLKLEVWGNLPWMSKAGLSIRGNHADKKEFRGETISFALPESMPAVLDGETFTQSEVSLSASGKTIKVIVSRDRKF